MKKVLFDLTQRCSWGDKGTILPHLYSYVKKGYKPFILTDEWNNPHFIKNKMEVGGKWPTSNECYHYNPLIEPIDFFLNLVSPSSGASFFDKSTNEGNCDPSLFKETSFDDVVYYKDKVWELKEVSQIEYKLNSKNTELENLQKELEKTINIVIYHEWLEFNDGDPYSSPDGCPRRRNGKNVPDNLKIERFNSIKKVVKDIDDFCLSNPKYRIVTLGKSARGLDQFLSSKFLNLCDFENFGLSFSDVIYLVCNSCSFSYGHCLSSLSLWISACSSLEHFISTSIQSPDRYFDFSYAGMNPSSSEIIKPLNDH